MLRFGWLLFIFGLRMRAKCYGCMSFQ